MFTAGGSDSYTLAIRGAARANRSRGAHVITQATEHPAVIEACRGLQADGFRLTILPVDRHGRVDPTDLRGAITDDTTLVSVMLAKAETGTLQPIAELARIAHDHGALFHAAAAQAASKIPLDVNGLGEISSPWSDTRCTPPGVGALCVRAGTPMQPTTHGGGQEHGLHAGTEIVALIAALAPPAASRRTPCRPAPVVSRIRGPPRDLVSRPGDADVTDPPAMDLLLAQARSTLQRVQPEHLADEVAHGAILIDIRPAEQRERDGDMPGAVVVDRNVLEWRLDPTSLHRLALASNADVRIVLLCNEGYSSSLAGATLQQLGLRFATDLVGGFRAWRLLRR